MVKSLPWKVWINDGDPAAIPYRVAVGEPTSPTVFDAAGVEVPTVFDAVTNTRTYFPDSDAVIV